MATFTEEYYRQVESIRNPGPDFSSPEMERIYYEMGRKYIKVSDKSILGVKMESYLHRYKDYYYTIVHLDERHREEGLFGNYFVALVISNPNISEDKISDIFGDKYFGIYKKANDDSINKDYKYHIIKTDFEWNRDDAEDWFKHEIDKLK